MCKKCWSLILVLLIIIGGGIYKFMIQGSVGQGSDGRVAIRLDAPERDLVLAEMRAFLAAIQQITSGIKNKDLDVIVDNARRVGRAAQGEVPASLMGKLPIEFKRLGLDTHSRFDQLALDAEQLGDTDYSLEQLSVLMENCVACHEAYRIEVQQRQ